MTMNTTDDFDHPDADAQDCGRKQSNHVIARSSLLFWLVFWIAVIVVAASQAQAFVVVTPSSSHHWTKLSNKSFQHRSILFAQHNDEHETSQHASNFAHSDIEWRLRPPEGTSRFNRLKVKLGAQILRLDCKLKGERLPSVLCPRGGRALLEAYYKGEKLNYVWTIQMLMQSLFIDSSILQPLRSQNQADERRRLLVLVSLRHEDHRRQKVSYI